MKKRRKNKKEEGQALVETILLIPMLFFILLWMTQFFIATQTSEIVQEKTRNTLVTSINNWRDLRDKNGGVNNISQGSAIDNIPNSLARYNDSGRKKGRLVYKNQREVKRDLGPVINGKEKLTIETKLGICRTTACN